jgi:hypothetical protein
MGQRVTCRLWAEYHQFYLLDELVKPRIPEEVTDAELISRLMVRPHLVVVLTFQPNRVAVAVETAGAEPPLDLGAWDHVAECDLDLPSGRVAVDQCVGTVDGSVVARLSVPPGAYRVRVCLGGIRDWADVPDGEDAPERYQVLLWPGSSGPLVVRKQWGGPISV